MLAGNEEVVEIDPPVVETFTPVKSSDKCMRMPSDLFYEPGDEDYQHLPAGPERRLYLEVFRDALLCLFRSNPKDRGEAIDWFKGYYPEGRPPAISYEDFLSVIPLKASRIAAIKSYIESPDSCPELIGNNKSRGVRRK